MTVKNKLSQGWVECEFGKIFEVVNGDRGKNYPAKNKLQMTGIPFVSAVNIQGGKLREDNLLCLTDEQYNLLNNGKINTEDTLLCIRGSIGKHCRYFKEKGAIASSMVIIRRNQFEVLNSLLHYYLDSHIMKAEIKKYDNGTAQPNLSAADLRKFYFPLPPLNEQKRIVEKIEKEFGKIDEGIEKLKLAQEQIKQYRQSVLKSAFAGKLYKTTEWEEKNITNICELKSGNTIDKSLEKENGEIPYVKVGDMNIPDNIEGIITSSRFVNLCDIKEDSLIPTGAIIFPKRGGAIATNKKRKVIKPIIIDLNTMAIIPKGNILSELLYYFMIKLDLSKISNGGAVPQINHYSFENIKINLPTINEQKQIVKEIEKCVEVADEVERVIAESLEKAEQLKQSILKKAFEGRLVPQDPTDQPASELLAQIQTERSK